MTADAARPRSEANGGQGRRLDLRIAEHTKKWWTVGIDVSSSRVVSVNPAHNHRVVTDGSAPVRSTVGGMVAYSIFRRNKNGDEKHDGNPLIYALKGSLGYTIRPSALKALHPPFCAAISEVVRILEPQTLIPIPSGSQINDIILERVRRECGGTVAECDCFEKLSIRDVLARSPKPREVRRADRIEYAQTLYRLSHSYSPSAPFEMKLVGLKIRPYFCPIGYRAGSWKDLVDGKRVVFVEDILASGTTLLNAQELLRRRYTPATLSVITLISKL